MYSRYEDYHLSNSNCDVKFKKYTFWEISIGITGLVRNALILNE